MGADTFVNYAEGADASQAFNAACEEALYDHGHSGYSGTIGEKQSFTVLRQPMLREDAEAVAWKLIDKDDPAISDKWGPAGAIPVADHDGKVTGWLFFGWASSLWRASSGVTRRRSTGRTPPPMTGARSTAGTAATTGRARRWRTASRRIARHAPPQTGDWLPGTCRAGP